MPRRTLLFVALALAGAALFIRLGFWQLDRLRQRRERNALLAERIAAAAAQWSDTTAVRYRRVRLAGKPDYEREIVLVGRSRDGSPGVNLVTPLRIAGSDSAVLVNRGWVYSPDATKVDQTAWAEGEGQILAVEGYVEAFAPPGPGDLPSHQWIARRLSYPAVAARLPYPLAPVYVVAIGTGTPPIGTPARAGIPTPDDGPHLGYALQWFAFAVIAVVGAGIAVRTGRRDGTSGSSHAHTLAS
jgi:surfeit locus 1 family protein